MYCLIVLFQSSQIRLVSVLYCLYSLQSTFSLWKMFALFTPEKSLFLLSVGGDIFARKNLVFCQNVAIVSIGTTKAGTIKSCFVVKSLIHKISQIRSCQKLPSRPLFAYFHLDSIPHCWSRSREWWPLSRPQKGPIRIKQVEDKLLYAHFYPFWLLFKFSTNQKCLKRV